MEMMFSCILGKPVYVPNKIVRLKKLEIPAQVMVGASKVDITLHIYGKLAYYFRNKIDSGEKATIKGWLESNYVVHVDTILLESYCMTIKEFISKCMPHLMKRMEVWKKASES